jgi:hypothetical protein
VETVPLKKLPRKLISRGNCAALAFVNAVGGGFPLRSFIGLEMTLKSKSTGAEHRADADVRRAPA